MAQSQDLKSWREAKGLTQAELAQGLRVHVQYVSAIERGVRTPGMNVARRIREFTGGAVTLDSLVPPSTKQAA